jgi:hypothetical protein
MEGLEAVEDFGGRQGDEAGRDLLLNLRATHLAESVRISARDNR